MQSWDKAAELRREQIESGQDITFSNVFVPYYMELVRTYKPNVLIEAGCGTGHLARSIWVYAAKTYALEPSEGMFAVASDVLRAAANVVLQHTRIQDAVGIEPADLIISHLVVNTIPDLDDFVSAVRRRLRSRGEFVFSIPHPCFWNEYKKFIPEHEYSYMTVTERVVDLTISLDPLRPISAIPFIHRPLSRYISCLRSMGFYISRLDEIFPAPEIQCLYGKPWESPRYMVISGRVVAE
jgi:SAM-dependent methyltransferase